MLLIGSLSAMWAWWGKQFHEPKCGSGHVCLHRYGWFYGISTCCIVTTIYNYTHIHEETKSTIMTNEYTSLENYTTSYLIWIILEKVTKGLCVRGELETEQTATYWPPVPLTIAALLSHSAGLLNRDSWGPSLLLGASSHCLELQQTDSS